MILQNREKLFFETIKVENSKAFNLDFHIKRMKKTIEENLNIKQEFNLSNLIKPPSNALYRCKIIYNTGIISINYYEYQKKEFKSFRLIESDINYAYKYLDRKQIEELFLKRKLCDDIIIINNGYLLDTSIANIALFIDHSWYTPKKPLLKGTFRNKLINENKIFEKNLKIDDLKIAKKFAILNAMVGFYEIKNWKIKEC